MATLSRLTNSGKSTMTPGSPKTLHRFQSYITSLFWPVSQRTAQQHKSVELDAIDSFTNDLVSQKTQKWEELHDNLIKNPTVHESDGNSNVDKNFVYTRFKQTTHLMTKGIQYDLQVLRSPQLGLDIRSLSQPQLDNLLLATLKLKNKIDFLYLIQQCVCWQKLPSNEVFISCLKYLSSLKRIQQLDSLAEICRQMRHPFAKTYADLAPFKAIALWHNGSADLALKTLHKGYGDSISTDEGRRMIRAAFRSITEETLAQKSEAVLVTLMKMARAIHLEHKDIFVIACVWKQCFVSDWFCDQKSASELFETYEELQELVARRANSLCSSFLGHNNVDAVHRLIEIFLQQKLHSACSNCLSLLFNYQYLQKDLRACAEVIKSCSELEMPLNKQQNEQFLNLFLNRSDPFKISAGVQSKAYNTPASYQYKF